MTIDKYTAHDIPFCFNCFFSIKQFKIIIETMGYCMNIVPIDIYRLITHARLYYHAEKLRFFSHPTRHPILPTARGLENARTKWLTLDGLLCLLCGLRSTISRCSGECLAFCARRSDVPRHFRNNYSYSYCDAVTDNVDNLRRTKCILRENLYASLTPKANCNRPHFSKYNIPFIFSKISWARLSLRLFPNTFSKMCLSCFCKTDL